MLGIDLQCPLVSTEETVHRKATPFQESRIQGKFLPEGLCSLQPDLHAACPKEAVARPLANWPSLFSVPGNSRKSLAKLSPFDVPFF